MATSRNKDTEILIQPVESTSLETVDKLSRLMDSKFRIPGTSIRFGLDPIFSLVPVFGDLLTYVISGLLIYTMYRHGASRKVVTKMVLNATLDAVIGSIPLVGSIFDVFYKANNRNVRLLKEHYYEGKHDGTGNGLILMAIIVLLSIMFLIFFILWKLISGLVHLLL